MSCDLENYCNNDDVNDFEILHNIFETETEILQLLYFTKIVEIITG